MKQTMEQKIEIKKARILAFLKLNGMSSTGKIANEIRSNQWMAEKYLKKLQADKIIKQTKTPNSTYWEIMNKDGNKN